MIKQVDGLIDVMKSLSTSVERQKVLDEIENLLISECAVIYLAHKKHGLIYHPSVRGIKMNTKGWVDFKDVWFDETLGNR